MLIAMAGLPGTGKSTIAARLAERLGGVVLCKDVVRRALFPPPALDYSREQDDLALRAMYLAANRIRDAANLHVVIDGRTFSKAYQVRDLFTAAERMGLIPCIIECICSDEVARERIERDLQQGTHPAGNRTFAMYLEMKARAEALTAPRLVLDTGNEALEECVSRAGSYVSKESLISKGSATEFWK